jgi:hypothetical protein
VEAEEECPLFSVMVRKEDLVNFAGDPKAKFEGKVVAVTGRLVVLGRLRLWFWIGRRGLRYLLRASPFSEAIDYDIYLFRRLVAQRTSFARVRPQ